MPSIYDLRKQAVEKLGFAPDRQMTAMTRSLIDAEVEKMQSATLPTAAAQDEGGGVADWLLEASKGFQMATQMLPNLANFAGNLAMDDFNQTAAGQATQAASNFFERGVQSATDLQSQGFRDRMAAPIYDDATGEWNAPSATQVFGTVLTALPQIPAYVMGAGAVGAVGNAARLAPRVYKLSKLAGMGSATSLKLARALPGMASYGVAGGAFGGADTFAESYGSVMEKLDEYDIPENQKDRVASKLATEAGLRQLPVAALMNAVGLGAAAQTTGALWKRIAIGAMEEIPSEAIEEGAQGLNVNLSTRKLDPTFDMWTGVRTRAALGAIAGGVMGAGVAAADGNPARQRQIAELRADLDATPDDILSGAHQTAIPESAPAPAQNTSVPRIAPPIPGRTPEAQQAWDVAEVAVSLAADSTDAIEQAIPNWSRMDNKAKAKIIDAVIDADGDGHTEKGMLVQKWAEHQAAAVAAVQQAHSLEDPTYGKPATTGNELVGGAEAAAPVASGGPAAGQADASLDAAGGMSGAEALAPAVRADVLPAGAATDLQPALTDDLDADIVDVPERASRPAASRVVNAERDDLLVAVAKMGGFSRTEAKSQGVDPADFRRRAGFGGVVFPKNGGLSFDAMAERLNELGYPVTDANGNYDPNVLLDKLLGALGGKKVRTPQGDAYAMQLEDQRRAVAMSKNSALPPSEAGPEFTPSQSAVSALFADAIHAGYSYAQLDAMLTDQDSLAEIHRKLSALLTGDSDAQPEGNSDRRRQGNYQEAQQGEEGAIPGFEGQSGEDLSDLTDDEVDRLFRGDRAADIRAARPAAGFSLSAQTEDDIRAKEAREQDAAAAEAGDRQRQVDATRDAFTLSTGTATAGQQLTPAVRGQGGDLFASPRAADQSGRRDNYHDEPTDAQKEAGNYKKEKVKWNGLDLSIESQAGTMRRGTDPNGKAWEVQLQFDYGYFRETEGADGDHVDVYMGPNLTGDRVFIVNQTHADGKFDEHKVMLGFDSLEAAKEGYLSNYEKGWDRIKDVVELSAEQFKTWLSDGDTKKPATAPAAATSEAPAATSRAKADTSGAASTKGEDAGARSSGERIEDFGEKIGGAKKDLWSSYSSSLKDALPDDIKDFTLSKHFPEPNYEKMIEAGASVEAMAAIRAMRDQMPAKPRQSWKLRMWADSLVMMRDVASQILDGKITMAELRSKLQGSSRDLSSFVDKIDIYAGLGFPAFMKANGADLRWGTHFTYEGDTRTDYPNQYGVFVNGRRVVDQFFKEKKDAIAALREHLGAVDASEKAPRETKLDLYRVTATGKVMIGKKIGTNRFIDLKQFETAKEARAYLQENEAELIAQLQKFREDQSNVPTRRSTNDPRRGEDYRKGEDITPERFGNAFSFRGVEFGNWVEQGRRKADLNNAYDALMDMAKIVGIPPKAVSLNGSLGLAFGARGNAGAAAHFEPGKVVINLTKKEGAGSLGHEWFHAMDNYFSRQRGKDADFVTAKPHELKETGLRPEVIAAFGNLMKIVSSSPMAKRSIALDKKRPKDYWSTAEELGARAFESYLIAKGKQRGEANDYLANLIDTDTAKVVFESGSSEWPYPFDGEIEPIVDAFDKLFETIQTKETDKGVAMYRRKEQTESPAFKKWFGDSKVVDKDGNPLAAYRGEHGETDGQFHSRLGSLSFGSKEAASTYATSPNNLDDKAVAPRVTPVFLRIENPIINNPDDPFLEMGDLEKALGRNEAVRIARKFEDHIENTDNWQSGISEEGFDSVGEFLDQHPERVSELYFDAYPYLDDAKEVARLKAAGFDGAIHGGNGETSGEAEYRIFDESQAKSATGNRGTFDQADPSIMNKRGDAPPALVSLVDAEASLRQDKFVARLLDAGRIVIHAGGNSLPGPGPDKGGILGVAMPDGVIHLNAGAHDTTASLMPTLLHEAFHARVQPLIGEKGWNKLMQSLDGLYEAGLKGDAKINAFFKQALDQVESDAVGQDKLTRAQKVEELGAYAIDHYDTAPKGLRMWVDMLLAKVKAWALRYFGAQLGKVSPAQLRELAKMAIRDTRYDAYRAEMLAAYHRAWHGSPHDFDRFTTAAMGTGEGAQAYGWGMYFAGRKEVAEHYRKALAATMRGFNYAAEAQKLDIDNYEDFRREFFIQAASDAPVGVAARRLHQASAASRTIDGATLSKLFEAYRRDVAGRLYEVELTPEESDYLLWDKPLSEQSKVVRQALDAAPALADWLSPNDRKAGNTVSTGGSMKGMPAGEFYRMIQKEMGGDKAASKYLNSLGIPGIKYLDGDSRNRPLKEIKREFLAELPEDAEFDEVMDLVGTGRFSPANEAILKALADNDWLGFDYPAQAISAALSNDLPGYDPTQALQEAVAAAKEGGTYNYVIFDDSAVEIVGKNSRAVDNPANEVTAAWKMLAADSDLFKLQKSTAGELTDIFAEIDSAIRVTESEQEAKRGRQETGKRVDRAFVVAMPRKKGMETVYDKVTVYQAGREVWINAATLKEGVSGGFKVYAAVGNYAFNSGRVFIGDPLGLSDMALLRRTEHMLSLALKFGTTDFMMPHQKQIAPASDSTSKLKGKVRPLDWRVGADEHNLVELVRSAYTNILPFAPEVKNVDFDPVSGRFLHAESRKPVSDSEWTELNDKYEQRLVGLGIRNDSGRKSSDSAANPGSARGSATLKRAAFAHTFLRRTSSAERRGLLAFLSGKLQGGIDGLAGVENTDLKDVFYRRAKAAPGNAPATLAAGTFDAAKDHALTVRDQLIYNYQDRFIDLRRLQDRMGNLPEQQDASLAETRYSGTVMARTQGFQQGERDPLIKAIHAAKLSYEEVEDYLNAKDAPYRNAAMKEINPTQQELDAKRAALEATIAQGFATPAVKEYLAARRDARRYEDEVDEGLADASALFRPKQRLAKLKKDPAVAAYAKATDELAVVRKTKAFDGDNTALSGLSDKDAAAIIDKARKDGKFAALEKLSKMVDDITTGTRQLLVDSGLSKAEEVAVWAKKYPHYVPRHREEVGGDTPVIGTGRGFNIRGKESKRATGSQRKVVDILAHIMAQRETAIIRAEKIKVDRALYEMLKANPDPSVAVLDSIAKVPVVDEATGAVVDRIDPLYKNRPNVLTFKMNGEEHTIEFNDENPEMVRLAVSMKNMDAQQLGAVTSMVGRFTRFLATMNTTANPVFIARNFMRDLQSAYVNLSDTELATMKKDVFRDIPAAIRGFWQMNEGKLDSEFAKHAKEFRDAGGQTGWMEHTQVIGDRATAMQKQLAGMEPGKWNMTKETASKLWQLVEDANNAVENGIRLSAFVNARRSGMTAGKAAALAKNLTVNFNRRGAKSVELNMWYMFMNASIQGTARIVKAAGNKEVQKIMGYIVASGFLLDLLARAMAGDDDDDGENDYDQLPEYVKATNWVFWIGGKPITIPQPYGYNFVSTAGRKVSETLFRENFSPLTGAADLANSFVGAFSPIGQAGSMLQSVAPTIADPFVQWAENKNFAGNPLYKEQLPYGVPKPEYQMAFRSTSESSKWLAEVLNVVTGGNEVRPGAININPASIDFAVSSLVGGSGRTYLQAFNLPIKLLSGDEVQAREVPFLNIFGSAKPESQIEGKFFDYLNSVELAAREAKEYAGTPEGAEIRKRNAAELGLVAKAKMTSASLRLLRDREKAVGLTREQKKALEQRRQALMAGFNKAYTERVL